MKRNAVDLKKAMNNEDDGYFYKVKTMGHVVKVYRYRNAPYFAEGDKKGGKDPFELDSEEAEQEKANLQERNGRYRKEKVIDLINANFTNKDKFYTFTFDPKKAHENGIDPTDITSANKAIDRFLKRLKRRYKDVKFLWVVEFHQKGSIHFHMICDLPYIPQKIMMNDIWKYGYCWVNRLDSNKFSKHGVDNVGAYVSKYMVKDNDDPKLKKKRSYNTSKGNLERPTVLYGAYANEEIKKMNLDDPGTKKQIVSRATYETETQGTCEKFEINLFRSPIITRNSDQKEGGYDEQPGRQNEPESGSEAGKQPEENGSNSGNGRRTEAKGTERIHAEVYAGMEEEKPGTLSGL